MTSYIANFLFPFFFQTQPPAWSFEACFEAENTSFLPSLMLFKEKAATPLLSLLWDGCGFQRQTSEWCVRLRFSSWVWLEEECRAELCSGLVQWRPVSTCMDTLYGPVSRHAWLWGSPRPRPQQCQSWFISTLRLRVTWT